MKSYAALGLFITVILFSFLIIVAFGNSIGYLITGACGIALAAFAVSMLFAGRDIKQVLSRNLNRYSLLLLFLVIVFFLLFSIFLLPKTNLIYFDENIYLGVALNILHNGNALQCLVRNGICAKMLLKPAWFRPSWVAISHFHSVWPLRGQQRHII